MVSQHEFVVVQLPPFQRYLCPSLSLHGVSSVFFESVCLSVIRACPPASKTLQQPFRPFSGDTIMQLCEQTNAVYDSWGWWRWGNAISLYPPALSPPFTQPTHGPYPQHSSLHTFSSPLFSLSMSSQACPSQPREQWGSCVCRLFPTITFNYGSLQCGLVKGLAIRSFSLFHCVCVCVSLSHTLSLLAQFWSLARLHVKTTQIAPAHFTRPTAHFT